MNKNIKKKKTYYEKQYEMCKGLKIPPPPKNLGIIKTWRWVYKQLTKEI